MESLIVGICLGLGLVVAAVVRFVLPRAGFEGRRPGTVALIAGAAAFGASFLFIADWLIYAIAENQPVYYDFSAYMEYRQLQDGLGGIAMGVGYAALAGALVTAAAVLRRRLGPAWVVTAVAAAVASVALPAVVPSSLPRAEAGRDQVFHGAGSSSNPARDPNTGRLRMCLNYGVERSALDPGAGEDLPILCMDFADTPAARRVTVDEVAENLNDDGVRPHQLVDDVGVEGVRVTFSEWPGVYPPAAPPPPASSDPPRYDAQPPDVRLPGPALPRDDAGAAALVRRVARALEACRRSKETYVGCFEDRSVRRAAGELTQISGLSFEGYTVSAQSGRGTTFTLTRTIGAGRVRKCAPRGRGACPAGGRW